MGKRPSTGGQGAANAKAKNQKQNAVAQSDKLPNVKRITDWLLVGFVCPSCPKQFSA
jgi:hypothetical protein